MRTSAAVGFVVIPPRYRRARAIDEITDSSSGIDLANVNESNAFCTCVTIFTTIELSVPWRASDRAFSMREELKHAEIRSSASAADFRVSRSVDSRKSQTRFHARGSSDSNSADAVSLYDARAFASTNVHAGDTVVSLGRGQAEWIADIMSGNWAVSAVSSSSEIAARRTDSVVKAERDR